MAVIRYFNRSDLGRTPARAQRADTLRRLFGLSEMQLPPHHPPRPQAP